MEETVQPLSAKEKAALETAVTRTAIQTPEGGVQEPGLAGLPLTDTEALAIQTGKTIFRNGDTFIASDAESL